MDASYRLVQEEPHTLIVQVAGRLTPDIARVMLDHARSYAGQIEGGVTTLIDLSRAAPTSTRSCMSALLRDEFPGVQAVFGMPPAQRLMAALSLKTSRMARRCHCFADEPSARRWMSQRQGI